MKRFKANRLALLGAVWLVAGVAGGAVSYRLLTPSPPPALGLVESRAELMGTRWVIQAAPDTPAQARTASRAIRAAFNEVARVESVMSEWIPDSPISRINRAAGGKAVAVPDELAQIIRRSQLLGERTGGAFDITWKGLGGLWQWDVPDFAPPSDERIAAALRRIGSDRIVVDENRVLLPDPGMAIGLGGIAKGYGIDRAARVLKEFGLENFYIDGGGDVLVAGRKFGRPWRVGIRHPRGQSNELLAVLEADSGAVVTSGDYARFREIDGVRYSHIIDPRTGRPAGRSQAVTVIGPTAESADALATAIFIMGPEEGLRFAENEPGLEALIVDAEGQVRATAGLQKRLQSERRADK